MSVLTTFPAIPPHGYVTVCERTAEMVAVPKSEVTTNQYLQNLHYPEVDLSTERKDTPAIKETARSAFLDCEDAPTSRLRCAWYEHGLTGILEELSNSKENGNQSVSSVCKAILGVVRWTTSLHGSLFPHLAMSSDELIGEFSQHPKWKSGVVRCFAWHPHTTKFAVSLHDDSIHVYTARRNSIVPVLKHKLQKGVADLQWSPLSASLLAVACQSCVLIWNVDPTSLATRPSTSAVQVLSRSGHCPVTSVGWLPQGGALVSASPADTTMLVWDVAMETCVPLGRVGGGGVSVVRWSPDGSKLLSACPSPIFRVWESVRWTCEKWAKLPARCKSGCWSNDGNILLFAVADQPVIYSLSFRRNTDGNQAVIGGSKVAISAVDLSETEIETEDGQMMVGGGVQSLAWDPTGERLAVMFQDGGRELIALFQTKLEPTFEVIPCGFIRGCPGEEPHLMSFQPHFSEGALLTVVWSSGRIAYLPLYFVPRSTAHKGRLFQHQSINADVTKTPLYTE